MGTKSSERLREILEPAVSATGLMLEEVAESQAGRRTVVLVTVDLPDGPGGVTSDQMSAATRAVSEALDAADPIPGPYTLEVSTPGVDRPLTTPRHFRRALGRLVEIGTAGGMRKGRLEDVTAEDVLVGDVRIPLQEILDAVMVVEFAVDKE